MLFLKQKADGPLSPQQGHSIYDGRLADGKRWLRVCAGTGKSVSTGSWLGTKSGVLGQTAGERFASKRSSSSIMLSQIETK